jgi:O-antigen/teichoic acid export membrane protein
MRRVMVPVTAIKVLGAVVITLGSAAVLSAAGENGTVVALVLILGGATALTMTTATAHSVFFANERMEHVFLTKVPPAIAGAAAGLAVVAAGGGLVPAVCASALGSGALGTLAGWSIVWRSYGHPQVRLSVREWPGLVRNAVPFGFAEMLGQVVFRFDTVLLAAVAASAVVGDYGAAYRMLEATLFIAWSVGFSVMSSFSTLDSSPQLTRLYEASIKLVLLAMAPIAAAMFVCAPAVIDLVYGLPEYAGSVDVLRLLAFAVAIYSVGHISGLLVLVRRKGRVTVAVSGCVAAVNVVLCAVLIPPFEEIGAAVSTVVAECLLAGLGLWLARAVTGPQRVAWTASPLIAAVAMGLVMWPVADRLWVALPLGLLAYLAALAAMEARRVRDDLALFATISGRQAPVETPVGT